LESREAGRQQWIRGDLAIDAGFLNHVEQAASAGLFAERQGPRGESSPVRLPVPRHEQVDGGFVVDVAGGEIGSSQLRARGLGAQRLDELKAAALCSCASAKLPRRIAAEAAGGVAGSGLSGARSARDLRSQRADFRFKCIALRFDVADAAEQVRFIALGQAGALADDVGPEASADAESREDAKPSAPRDLKQARAQDVPQRRRLQSGEGERDDERVQEDGDRDPDGGQSAVTPADDGAPHVHLGESDEHGERRRADPKEGGAGFRCDLLAVGSDDDKAKAGDERKDGEKRDPAAGMGHGLPFRVRRRISTGGDLVGRPSARRPVRASSPEAHQPSL
jgi:hypothetical protein